MFVRYVISEASVPRVEPGDSQESDENLLRRMRDKRGTERAGKTVLLQTGLCGERQKQRGKDGDLRRDMQGLHKDRREGLTQHTGRKKLAAELRTVHKEKQVHHTGRKDHTNTQPVLD